MFTTKHIFVQMDKALNDEIVTKGGIKLYIDPKWNKEWNATVTGTVSALPQNGYKDLKEGDEVAFSYRVVSERQYTADGHHFHPHIDAENIKEWISGKGERIRILGYMGTISRKWIGTYLNRRLDLIDGLQGTQSDIERWLAQFTFGNTSQYIFKNRVTIDDKDYWKTTFDYVIAKKEGDEIKMLCDKILVKPIDIDITQRVSIMNGIHLPEGSVKARFQDKGEALTAYPEMGIKKGDVICFPEAYTEKYKLWDGDYFLVKPERVQGIAK